MQTSLYFQQLALPVATRPSRWSTSNYGVSGDSQTFAGVRGTSVNAAGTEGWSTNGAGVLATSQAGDGVYAESQGPNSSGIHAVNVHGGNAATFDGNVQINGNMSVNNINVADDILFAGGQDCAEHFEAAEGQQVIPGTVMVIQDSGLVASCSRPYDKRAAGVVTGAGPFRPAMILGKGASDGSRLAIALIGKVCCLVDADLAPVETGDLLTTSTTTGHAMKATDQASAFGAVIGKALGSLSSGKGLVPILVCLQ